MSTKIKRELFEIRHFWPERQTVGLDERVLFSPQPAGPDGRSTLPLATLQWRRSIVDETTIKRLIGGGRLLTNRGYNNTIKSAPNAEKDDQKILLNNLMVKENISLEISLLLVTFCSNVV